MNTEIIIQKEPLKKITFYDSGFKVSDNSLANKNNFYNFKDISDLKLKYKKINWFVSLISIVIDLLTGSAMGGIFKNNKLKILFKYHNQKKTILFKLDDEENTKKIISLLSKI